MTRETYLQRARECREMARTMRDPSDKEKLIEIAEAWLQLAEDETALQREVRSGVTHERKAH